jgi:hypothetical protein
MDIPEFGGTVVGGGGKVKALSVNSLAAWADLP